MNNIVIPEFFDENSVPVDYQWSGYSTDSKEFKETNFLKINIDGLPTYICSEENGVALGDYLSKYIFNQPFFQDMETVFSPGYNYWFFKAWEQSLPEYSELDSWVHQLVDLLISAGLIVRFESANTTYFAFSDLSAYEDQPLPDHLINEAKRICEKALVAFCRQSFTEFGSIEELLNLDIGAWAAQIIGTLVDAHRG